jgi:assimilatory nitrate reductase catalytic subunit
MPDGAGAGTRTTRSTCPYCGVGCGVLIDTRNDEIVGVRGDPDHPANVGRLCTKGSTLHLTARPLVQAQVRALHPELRTDRGAARRRTGWDAALDFVAARLADTVRAHGPDSVGLYVSGQLLTEDYYVFNKLAKGLLGTNNIDTNSRLCMSSAVAGYKATLGADSVPCCYDDVDQADLIFVAGSNTAYAHPVLYRRIEDARRRRPQVKLVVVDPRATDTARDADLHLQIVPGTDVALFHGLLHLLLWERRVDERYVAAHTEGFAALRALVRDYTPKQVAQTCGIPEAALGQAARWWGASAAVLSLYCQGLNQSAAGTDKNAALINLHLATAQIGRPGAGPFSLTGQPNAMGGREVGGLANLLSAHRDLGNPAHRAEIARLWGVPEVPAAPGRTAVEMFEAAARGEIRALWIACTNPAQSLPNQALVRAALERAEFVVLQEAYTTTATVPYADVLLPAASWGERDGTVTNSERRISRVRRAVAPPGEAREDWSIAADVARRLERVLRPGAPSLFAYASAEDVWNEHRASTLGRDLDIGGLTYAQLERAPQQWPFPPGATQGRARLYEDGRYATPNGRARFAAVPYRPVAEDIDARFPLRLTTGRLRDQWHAMSRTGTVGRLFGHAPEPAVRMHPSDLARRGLAGGDLLHVTSRRGSLVLPVQPDDALRAGEAFIAMHWGAEFVGGRGDERAAWGVNTITHDALDPASRQPELKHAAVRVSKAELPWRYVAFARVDAARQLSLRATLRAQLESFAFAACVPFGHDDDRAGLLVRAAAARPPAADVLFALEERLGLAGADVLRYDDRRRGLRHRLRTASGRLQAVALAGPAAALAGEIWLRELLDTPLPAGLAPHRLLVPSAAPPVATAARGAIVCNCHDVSATEIAQALAQPAGATPPDRAGLLSALQAQLKCGTHCGSCLPEVRRLVDARLASAPASGAGAATGSAAAPGTPVPALGIA